MIHRNEWRHHHEGEIHKKNDRHKARRTLCETHHAPRKAVQFHDVILLKPRRCSSLLHSWLFLWRHFDIFGFSTPLEFYVSKQSISLCVSPRLAMLRSVPSRPHVKWLVNFFIKTKKKRRSPVAVEYFFGSPSEIWIKSETVKTCYQQHQHRLKWLLDRNTYEKKELPASK
jgi:hypothetical protein